MINSEQLLKHWIDCQTTTDPRYNDYIEQGKKIAVISKKWKLIEIPVNEILNYQNSELENSGPLIYKINSFLSYLKNINDIPPIILIPVDRKNKRPFIKHRYSPEIKWEAADGVHRLHLFLQLGLNKIKSYIPVIENSEDDNENS